jgi:hypothetical protein
VSNFGELISLEAYRKRKASTGSAPTALARPPLPVNFLGDHRLAFLAASEQDGARALCLLLNGRPVSAGLHHISSLFFRAYAQSEALSRFRFIHEHLTPEAPSERTVHTESVLFFRSVVETFYREHAKEVHGESVGRFSVADDIKLMLEHFSALGYEHRYNAILNTYSASLRKNGVNAQRLVIR